MRVLRTVAVIVAVLLCAACSGAGGRIVTAARTPAPAPATPSPPASTATLVQVPGSVVAVAPADVPSSTVALAAVGVSTSAATRVRQTLSELAVVDPGAAATTGAVGTVLAVPEAVLFDFGSAELRAGAGTALDRVAEVVLVTGAVGVEIRGHTDGVGSAAANQALSEGRAAAVAGYLATAGVDPAALVVRGLGETQPLAPEVGPEGADDPVARERNRRVEVVLPPGTALPAPPP